MFKVRGERAQLARAAALCRRTLLRKCLWALRINRFLHGMTRPEHRAAFVADENAAYAAAGLNVRHEQPAERRNLRQRHLVAR